MTKLNPSPLIVCMGGGTGLPVILRGLKKLDVRIIAIPVVTDDGGSSGLLRSEFNIAPPGDIRNALIALTRTESFLNTICQYRFQKGTSLAGHSLGNLILAAVTNITGSFTKAIQEISNILALKGTVLPVSEQHITLWAQMVDGSIIKGESNISNEGKGIKQLFLEPSQPEPLPEVIQAIQEADAIIAAPGSLYTSILPNLLINKVATTIKKSNAKKIFICNIMTQPGETDNFKASDHVQVILEHLGFQLFDIIIVNNEIPPKAMLKKYQIHKQEIVQADISRLKSLGNTVIADRFLNYHSVLRHDADKVSKYIWDIISR